MSIVLMPCSQILGRALQSGSFVLHCIANILAALNSPFTSERVGVRQLFHL